MVTGDGDNSSAVCVKCNHSAKQTPWNGSWLTAKVKEFWGEMELYIDDSI